MRNSPQPISNIANNLSFHEQPEAPQDFELPPKAIAIVNDLFNDLKGICTAWKQTFTDTSIEQAAKQQWAQALLENGIVNQQQIDMGMKKARRLAKPWFPSPGQFIEWCKPCLEDFGLLPAEQALRVWVNRQSKSCPAIYVAAQATGSWALKSMNHQDLLKLFTRNYEIACARVMAGEDLTQAIPLALPAKVVVITAQAQAIKNAKNLRALLESKRVNHA